MPAGEQAMQTGRPSTRRAARSRPAENEQMQTRSQAAVRRSTAASGRTAAASLMSMLKRASGQAPIRSSISGIGSVPQILAAATSRCGSVAISPGRPVSRSSALSWKASSTPSAVARASVSRNE